MVFKVKFNIKKKEKILSRKCVAFPLISLNVYNSFHLVVIGTDVEHEIVILWRFFQIERKLVQRP
jgi:hypothetical protein